MAEVVEMSKVKWFIDQQLRKLTNSTLIMWNFAKINFTPSLRNKFYQLHIFTSLILQIKLLQILFNTF